MKLLGELKPFKLVGVVVSDGVEKGQDNGNAGLIRAVRNVDLGGERGSVVAELGDELLVLWTARAEEPVKLGHVLLLVTKLNTVRKILKYL